MRPVNVEAPGKLLLIGEYAVLDGAPALVMAVDRRVRVRIAPAIDGAGRLSAPQLGIDRAVPRLVGDELRCTDARAELGPTGRVIPRILRELGGAPDAFTGLDLEIDSGELFESRAGEAVKLGLGSSAAVSAALALGLGACFEPDRTPPQAPALLERWLPAYRDALGGRASGADLAASLCGGLVEFRTDGETGHARPASWPEGLFWRAVWTGRAARTTDFVAAFDAWKGERPAEAESLQTRMNEISSRAAAAVGDAGSLLDAVADYGDALRALGAATGLEIMSAPHRRLAELAGRGGVVYKSCGAGGGDFGIALSPDPERLEAFARGASGANAVPLDLKLSETGASSTPREGSLPDKDKN